ncbi:hypothetical protein SAMN02787142_3844 [Burkholderia sp. WP9]|uniref:hypothetical protein n=1 Tax=Burkholderia sp. WP9 TaxID=1500263 RepID=UPI00089BBA2A|nr:hypothetical protein [Burkholderia sp. WP9]SED79022.1 hypothetical protein SAMN02787142_3844 [Burkholderia sp. WP9]
MELPNYPRLAISRNYLRDARQMELSSSTRLRCAWESIYFCCCEVAALQGRQLDGLEHPEADIVDNALRAIALPEDEQRHVLEMFNWAVYQEPLLPGPSLTEDACDLAEEFHDCKVAIALAKK